MNERKMAIESEIAGLKRVQPPFLIYCNRRFPRSLSYSASNPSSLSPIAFISAHRESDKKALP